MVLRRIVLVAVIGLVALSFLGSGLALWTSRPSAPVSVSRATDPVPRLLGPESLAVCHLAICEMDEHEFVPGSEDWQAFARAYGITVTPTAARSRTILIETMPIPLVLVQTLLTFGDPAQAREAVRLSAASFPDARPLARSTHATGFWASTHTYQDISGESTLVAVQRDRFLLVLEAATLRGWQASLRSTIEQVAPDLVDALSSFGSTTPERTAMREALLADVLQMTGLEPMTVASVPGPLAGVRLTSETVPICRFVPCRAETLAPAQASAALVPLALPGQPVLEAAERLTRLTPPLFRSVTRLVITYPDTRAAEEALERLHTHPHRWPDQVEGFDTGTTGPAVILQLADESTSTAWLILGEGNRLVAFALQREEARARHLLDTATGVDDTPAARGESWERRIGDEARGISELLAVVASVRDTDRRLDHSG
ncbi:hypothetical protein OO015_12845 [Thermomicrobium sp. 4228-Ro]|uniref:hypothetical protein n=1 Tax=Thermomicrobium sp. 4228-Ro TaxID=2993937 RepID=UPI002248E936|nr:hypothetical protein [Thermomicrobium sp. 4228-Ro]MCX2728378.1 hypothetical protein [Thermomicrobium sp. 4228-Ro]